jgi:hypothetical protein
MAPNGDGPGIAQPLWALFDADTSGAVTKEEWIGAFNAVDRDGDGSITKREFVNCGGVEKVFQAFSRRNKCAVTLDEWCKVFESMDTNKSKTINAEEWKAFLDHTKEENKFGLSKSEKQAAKKNLEVKKAQSPPMSPQPQSPKAGLTLQPQSPKAGLLVQSLGGRITSTSKKTAELAGVPYPQEMQQSVPRVWSMFASGLRDDAFMDRLTRGGDYDKDEAFDLANMLDAARPYGPPNFVILAASAMNECNIYGGKMQVLHAEHRTKGWGPVDFHGAFDRVTKTLYLNSAILKLPSREIECVLIQLMAYWVIVELHAGDIDGNEGFRALNMMTDLKVKTDVRQILQHYNEHGFIKTREQKKADKKFLACEFAWTTEALAGKDVISESRVIHPTDDLLTQAPQAASTAPAARRARSPAGRTRTNVTFGAN